MSRIGSTSPAPWSFADAWGARGWLTDLDGPVHWIEFGQPAGEHRTAPAPAAEDSASRAPAGAHQAVPAPTGAHQAVPAPTGEHRAVPAPAAEGSASRAPIVFVHGLGGSHLNWVTVGPALAVDRRAIALDLRGFGLTPGTRRNSTVPANVELLDRFVREVVGVPVVLVGNSMGGLISIMQAHEHPETVAGLVLISPALPQLGQRPELRVAAQFLAYTLPGVGELYLRGARSSVTPRQLVRLMLRLCFADPDRAPGELFDALVALAEERRRVFDADVAFLAAARSTMWSIMLARRYRTVMRAVRAPVLLISGEDDRLVSVDAARAASRANPGWETRFLTGVGHTAQLEVPELVRDTMLDWLARHPTPATARDLASGLLTAESTSC